MLTVSSTSHRARRQFSPLRTDEVLHQIIGRRRRLKLSSMTPPIALLRPAPASSSSALVAATQPRFCDIVAHARHRRGLPPSCSGPHLRLPMRMRARGQAQSLRTLRGAHGTVLRFRWRGRCEERATSRDLGFSPSAATRAKDMDIFACARMIGRLRYVCKNVTMDLVLSSPTGVGAARRSIRAFKDR